MHKRSTGIMQIAASSQMHFLCLFTLLLSGHPTKPAAVLLWQAYVSVMPPTADGTAAKRNSGTNALGQDP